MSLVRSKQRVVDHGEVFTPPELVDGMIGLVGHEADRIDSRFLEPACGSGNFLVPILERKLQSVQSQYGKSLFERRHHALLAVMSIYGIDILLDNVEQCRANLVSHLLGFLGSGAGVDIRLAAEHVTHVNIVHGDALTMRTVGLSDLPIAFAEWSYLGKGQYQRRDFRFDALTQISTFGEEDTLFADLGKHEIFMPTADHGVMSILELGGRVS